MVRRALTAVLGAALLAAGGHAMAQPLTIAEPAAAGRHTAAHPPPSKGAISIVSGMSRRPALDRPARLHLIAWLDSGDAPSRRPGGAAEVPMRRAPTSPDRGSRSP